MVSGDLLFFYLSKRGVSHIRRLAKSRLRDVVPETLAALRRAEEQATRYGEAIFAYAIVAGAAERQYRDPSAHFESRIFLPLDEVHVFAHPLPARDFSDLLRINKPLVHLNGAGFDELKRRLAARNGNLGPLEEIDFGDFGLAGVKKQKDWHAVLRRPEVRFLYEEQVSEYFVEPLLAELRDPGTSVLKECWCEPRDVRAPRGRADYFVRVQGAWVPVEVKLDLRQTQGFLAQVAQYMHLHSFTPAQGTRVGEVFETVDAALCVAIDRGGVCLVHNGVFVAGEPGAPRWRREELSTKTAHEIRRVIADELPETGT
jgi:hypothetical protein